MLEVRDTDNRDTATAVVCRPAGVGRQTALMAALLWPVAAAGIWFVSYLVTGSTRPSNSVIWGGSWFGIWTLPVSIWGILYLTRARIVADRQGLRWRGRGRWHQAAWKEIVSYSDGTPKAPESAWICTLRETLLISRGSWTSEEALREAVQRNATAALESSWRAATPSEPKTIRVPFECHYDTAINRNILGWMGTVHRYGLLAVAVYFGLQWGMTRTLPGWGWLLTPTGLFVIAKQTLPLLWRPMYRATQCRLGSSVFVDKDGLRFIDGNMDTLVAWTDITAFYSLGIRSVIFTRDGGEYDFLDTLTESDRLKRIIPYMAVNARYRGWLTGIVQRQQVTSRDGRQSMQCFYRYRSLYNCKVLWLMTVFAALIAVPPVFIGRQGSIGIEEREYLSLFLLLSGLLPLLWVWGNYWRGGIRTDEEGIMQQTMFGRRFIPWGQVHAFRWRGQGSSTRGCVEGINGTITFGKAIADCRRLVDEIAAHGIAVRHGS